MKKVRFQQSHYDSLTKLPNRALFAERFKQAIAHNNDNDSLFAICFLDLDNFKQINDAYGHQMGDQVLIEVASRLVACLRESDTVSRQGGDEFTLLLDSVVSFAECEQLLIQIFNSLTRPYLINDQNHRISASIGVTLYPLDNTDLDTLTRHADQAMYQAKLAGKNQYFLFNASNDQQIFHKQQKLQEIRYALENKQFCLYYQPKVNMKYGTVYGAEALIRWLHPEKGLIPPLEFLPFIENTALEIEIGTWVINEALQQLSLWLAQDISLKISINIASYHLQSTNFINHLDAALAQYPELPSQLLQLEILESSAIGDTKHVSNIIKTCRDTLGVSIALDDFGTGYSSLTHLRNLPVETIKMDRSFVADLLDDPNDFSIIDSIINLAKAFNRKIIAEGVETVEHGLMLLTMGCHNAQGHFISKPIPATELPAWLNSYSPNQQWLNCSTQQLTVQQQKIKFIRLTTQRWLNKIETALQTPISSDNIKRYCWIDKIEKTVQATLNENSTITVTLSHLGFWLEQLENENLFTDHWLDQLHHLHEDLFLLGEKTISAYLEDDQDTVTEASHQLRSIYNKLIQLLDNY